MDRREMLKGAGALAGAAALSDQANAEVDSPARKYKIVVTGGHPGDPEYGCGSRRPKKRARF